MDLEALQQLTINQLRRLSTQSGLSGAGKKVDIIQRLLLLQLTHDGDADDPDAEEADEVPPASPPTASAKKQRQQPSPPGLPPPQPPAPPVAAYPDPPAPSTRPGDIAWTPHAAATHAPADLRWILNQMQARLDAVAPPGHVEALRRSFAWPNLPPPPAPTPTPKPAPASTSQASARRKSPLPTTTTSMSASRRRTSSSPDSIAAAADREVAAIHDALIYPETVSTALALANRMAHARGAAAAMAMTRASERTSTVSPLTVGSQGTARASAAALGYLHPQVVQ
jgi:hypothetical protein